jgi:probable phosphoglycerate mutase
VSEARLPELAISRLILWRHGRTEWNASGRFQGQLDPPLDDQGRAQAAAAAPLLAGGLSADDTVVVSSDLSRTTETAQTLTALLGVPLRLDPRLREHGLGSWEGLTRAEVADRYPDQYADWLAGRPVQGRGGEESADVTARALAALADLPEARNAVVVTHGGTGARLIEALLGLGPAHRRVFGPLANCSWSELLRQGDRWRLMRHNSSAPQTGPRREGVGDGRAAAATTVPAGASPEEGGPASGDAEAVL